MIYGLVPPWVTQDTEFLLREAEEHGHTYADEEVSHPELFGIGGGEDMVHPIGGEVIDSGLRQVVEVFLVGGVDIDDTEVHEGPETDAAVDTVSGSGLIVRCAAESRELIPHLGMGEEVELDLQGGACPLDRYILAEAMVIHLFPYTDIAFVQSGGGSDGGDACLSFPESIGGFDTDESVAYTEWAEDIMTEVERYLAIELGRLVETVCAAVLEGELNGFDV